MTRAVGSLLPALLVAALGAGSCGEPAAPKHGSDSPAIAWKASINDGNKDLEWGGIPAIGDGKLFIADGPRITALNAETGQRLWTTRVRLYDAPVASKIIWRNSQIFF